MIKLCNSRNRRYFINNKKVLLRERKRHTARCVAITISCYSGGGSLDKKFFFPDWTSIKPNLVSKIFPFTWGWGVPWQKNFFPVWTCIKPNLVSKFVPFTGGGGEGGSLDKKNFSQSEHVSSQIWCQKFFPLLGGWGVPWQKIFFPVWTCIKPNLVSKIFPFTGGGDPLTKKIFPSLNMYQAKSGVKNFSLYWDWVPPPPENLRLGTPPPNLRLGTPLPQKSETGYPPKNLRLGTPHPKNLRPGTPPHLDLDLGIPPLNRHTPVKT